jgi:hypothetical protein
MSNGLEADLIGKVVEFECDAQFRGDEAWHRESRRLLVESVLPAEGKPTHLVGRDLGFGGTRMFAVGFMANVVVRDATPEVLFPRLGWKYVGVDGSFTVIDPRESLARASLANRRPRSVHPVSSATCLPSRTCLAE